MKTTRLGLFCFLEEFDMPNVPFVDSLVVFAFVKEGLILIIAIFSHDFFAVVITLQALKVYTMPVNHIPMLMLCISLVS